MRNKRNWIIGVLAAVLILAPPAMSGGGGWRFFEDRLGLVEQSVADVEAENSELQARVAGLELQMLLVKSRLACVEEGLRGYGKCRQKTLGRR
jgi:hypothetical protein